MNDYLDLRYESNIGKILQKGGEDLAKTVIFSDFVTRINSKSERKVRAIVITSKILFTIDKSIYILIPEKKKEYKLKNSFPLIILRSVCFPKNNKVLFKLSCNGIIADQLLESFRRSKLILFLRDVTKALGHSVRVELSNSITILNRFNKTQNFSTAYDHLLRPEFQEMFRVAEKVGYIRRLRVGPTPTPETNYLVVLTDMGLLLLDSTKFEFRAFIPLLGVKLRHSSHMRQDAKGGGVHMVEVAAPGCSDRDVLLFLSDADRQEWISKMLKVQEKAISV